MSLVLINVLSSNDYLHYTRIAEGDGEYINENNVISNNCICINV